MAVVKYMSTDIAARTATFDVDGVSVTRQIADHVSDDTLDAHLQALADGLLIEYAGKETPALTKDPTTVADTVLAGE